MKIAYPLALGCALLASPALADGPFGPDTGFHAFGGSAPALEWRAFAVTESQQNDPPGAFTFSTASVDLRYVYRSDRLTFGLGAAVYAYDDDVSDPDLDPRPYGFVQFGAHRLTYGAASEASLLVNRRLVGTTSRSDIDPLLLDDVVRYDFLGNDLLISASLRKEINAQLAASYTTGRFRAFGTARFRTDTPENYFLEYGGEYAVNDRLDVGLFGSYSATTDTTTLFAGIDWQASDALRLSAMAGGGNGGNFEQFGVGATYAFNDRLAVYAGYDGFNSFGSEFRSSKIGLMVNF